MVGQHVSFLEEQVLQAEKAHAVIPYTVRKLFGSAAIPLFNKVSVRVLHCMIEIPFGHTPWLFNTIHNVLCSYISVHISDSFSAIQRLLVGFGGRQMANLKYMGYIQNHTLTSYMLILFKWLMYMQTFTHIRPTENMAFLFLKSKF